MLEIDLKDRVGRSPDMRIIRDEKFKKNIEKKAKEQSEGKGCSVF